MCLCVHVDDDVSGACRTHGKEKEAEVLLKDSIRFGPHFADAYSSLASLYAEQVTTHLTDTYKYILGSRL